MDSLVVKVFPVAMAVVWITKRACCLPLTRDRGVQRVRQELLSEESHWMDLQIDSLDKLTGVELLRLYF